MLPTSPSAMSDQPARASSTKMSGEPLFSPGIKKTSSTDVALTLGNDFTDFADITAISGHGAGGDVWGGGAHAYVAKFANTPPEPTSDRLKYVIIASCYNLSQFNNTAWLKVMRRPNPIHGLLGYGSGYPGQTIGRGFFQRFVANLRAKSGPKGRLGTMPILDAWRSAHVGPYVDKWACMLHAGCRDDCLEDWLKNRLSVPDPDGDILWFDESRYPEGQKVEEKAPDYSIRFVSGSTVVTRENTGRKDVGLFPGEGGFLEVASNIGTFSIGDAITVTFYYYRPDHDGMDLPALLTFGTTPEGDLALKRDLNKLDKTTNIDGCVFTFKSSGMKAIRIPYTVQPSSPKAYEQAGDTHGYFNLRVTPPGSTPGGPSDIRDYRDGAWLRPKRP
jgi:hypothetical protein